MLLKIEYAKLDKAERAQPFGASQGRALNYYVSSARPRALGANSSRVLLARRETQLGTFYYTHNIYLCNI